MFELDHISVVAEKNWMSLISFSMLSLMLLYSCGIAVCDTYVLPGNSYWLSNVCSIRRNAGFSTILKGSISLAIKRTTLSVSAHHFALSCLYFVCRLNAPVMVHCREDEDGPSVVAFFFPSGKTATDDCVLGACACLLCYRF